MIRRLAIAIAATTLVLNLAACGGAEEARRAAAQATLTSELQDVDGLRQRVVQQVAALERRAADLDAEVARLQEQAQAIERGTAEYMMSHKMAVAALAAGAAGGLAALDDRGQLTQEARGIGAAVGLVALGWALFNMDDVLAVADALLRADQALKANAQGQASLRQSMGEVRQQLAGAQAELQRIQQAAQGLRQRLASVA